MSIIIFDCRKKWNVLISLKFVKGFEDVPCTFVQYIFIFYKFSTKAKLASNHWILSWLAYR